MSCFTFGFLRCLITNSLSAVEAVGFDALQIQHLCVLTNVLNLVSDSVQGHDFSLCRIDKKYKIVFIIYLNYVKMCMHKYICFKNILLKQASHL